MTIQIRPIISTVDIEQAIDLHGAIWFTDDRDAIPGHLFTAIQHIGGLTLGAFDLDRLVGFLIGFPAIRDGKLMHWSHATGVLPEYQGRGIGSRLKWWQRNWALDQGYDCIAWTFDPLQSGNGKFNIHQLGCICTIYHIDFYGEVLDGLNRGLPTDRFEVRWWLKSERVRQCSGGQTKGSDQDWMTPFALKALADGRPEILTWSADISRVLAEIPASINDLRTQRPELAMQWRLAARRVFPTLFEDGFAVVDLITTSIDGRSRLCYVLERT